MYSSLPYSISSMQFSQVIKIGIAIFLVATCIAAFEDIWNQVAPQQGDRRITTMGFETRQGFRYDNEDIWMSKLEKNRNGTGYRWYIYFYKATDVMDFLETQKPHHVITDEVIQRRK